MKRLLSSLLVVLPTSVAAAPSNWTIDPAHTVTSFAAKHLVISTVRGEFEKTTGILVIDEENVANSRVEATIDANTISTRVEARDNHLKSPDFLDVARYPTITFKSTKVVRTGEDTLNITGDLTLHGVTRPATLAVTVSPAVKGMYGETRRGFSATTRINRKDFGVQFGKVVEAGPVVGDEVAITLDVEITRDEPKAAAR